MQNITIKLYKLFLLQLNLLASVWSWRSNFIDDFHLKTPQIDWKNFQSLRSNLYIFLLQAFTA